MSHGNGSFVGPQGSWSEWADEDLLMNLGPRERTRQEVLWEIVSSEERSVRPALDDTTSGNVSKLTANTLCFLIGQIRE